MKHVVKILPLALVLLIAVGCATIFSGTKANISVSSSPNNATVEVKMTSGMTVATGTTPAYFTLDKKNSYTVTIKMQGYRDQTVFIGQSFNTWFIGNIICGGVIGMVIDFVDGAMWNLEPNQIHVELVTAMLDGQEQKYAVIGALDDDGQLRTMAVPLIPVSN